MRRQERAEGKRRIGLGFIVKQACLSSTMDLKSKSASGRRAVYVGACPLGYPRWLMRPYLPP